MAVPWLGVAPVAVIMDDVLPDVPVAVLFAVLVTEAAALDAVVALFVAFVAEDVVTDTLHVAAVAVLSDE